MMVILAINCILYLESNHFSQTQSPRMFILFYPYYTIVILTITDTEEWYVNHQISLM